MEKRNDKRKARVLTLENGVTVTIHYESGGESLEDKMAAILATHITGRSES